MHMFFHGWRRKAGVVLLVMACLLMAGWIRSRVTIDWVRVYIKPDSSILLESGGNRLLFQTSFDPHDPPMVSADPIWYGSYRCHPLGPHEVLDPLELEGRILPSTTIPYWSIVLPLALLSAYLLLWNPRKRPSPN